MRIGVVALVIVGVMVWVWGRRETTRVGGGWGGRLPASLAEMPRTRGVDAAVARLMGDGAGMEPAMTDYALATYSGLDQCVAGRVGDGWATVELGFVRGARRATGTEARVVASNLGERERAVVEGCLEKLHRERVMELPEGARGGALRLRLEVRFPVATSEVYRRLGN